VPPWWTVEVEDECGDDAMRQTTAAVLIALMAMLVMTSAQAQAEEEYRLELLPTYNVGEASGAGGTMTIKVYGDRFSVVSLTVRNLFPHTVYTIWTVFNDLAWRPGYTTTDSNSVPACAAGGGSCRPMITDANGATVPGPSIVWKGWDGYPPEGGKVSPTGALKAAFTHGIRLDPGATFVTDRNGNGHVMVKLDFDMLDANPVSMKQLLQQCRPGTFTGNFPGSANATSQANAAGCARRDDTVDVTTTWLRRFIGEFPLADRERMCANYDPAFDSESPEFDAAAAHHTDSRFWQCVDPETDMVRVHRYPFAHFRIANHPDALTHGHIGGDHNDHWIDLVGPRECIVPIGNAVPVKLLQPAAGTVGYAPFPVDQCKPLTNGRRARGPR
jgi:hypothetical protein